MDITPKWTPTRIYEEIVDELQSCEDSTYDTPYQEINGGRARMRFKVVLTHYGVIEWYVADPQSTIGADFDENQPCSYACTPCFFGDMIIPVEQRYYEELLTLPHLRMPEFEDTATRSEVFHTYIELVQDYLRSIYDQSELRYSAQVQQ